METDAIRLGEAATLDDLYACKVAVANPRAAEVGVRLRASSLNYHDFAVVTGILRVRKGLIPLSDGAGEVTSVGDQVSRFKVGDRVMTTFFTRWLEGDFLRGGFEQVPGDGFDGYARRMAVIHEDALTCMPADFTFEQAATLPCAGVTAWRALMVDGNLRSGETVLIQGSGGVSLFALQLAKSVGATVIATSSSDEKLARLRALGADHLINYRSTPQWGDIAQRMAPGGVDHVVEVGGVGTLPQSIAAVRNGGHIALIGALTGREGPVPTALLMRKQVRLIGLTVGSRRHQLDFVRSIESTGLRPVIDRSFPLEQLADAFRYQASGKHFGKIGVVL